MGHLLISVLIRLLTRLQHKTKWTDAIAICKNVHDWICVWRFWWPYQIMYEIFIWDCVKIRSSDNACLLQLSIRYVNFSLKNCWLIYRLYLKYTWNSIDQYWVDFSLNLLFQLRDISQFAFNILYFRFTAFDRLHPVLLNPRFKLITVDIGSKRILYIKYLASSIILLFISF